MAECPNFERSVVRNEKGETRNVALPVGGPGPNHRVEISPGPAETEEGSHSWAAVQGRAKSRSRAQGKWTDWYRQERMEPAQPLRKGWTWPGWVEELEEPEEEERRPPNLLHWPDKVQIQGVARS